MIVKPKITLRTALCTHTRNHARANTHTHTHTIWSKTNKESVWRLPNKCNVSTQGNQCIQLNVRKPDQISFFSLCVLPPVQIKGSDRYQGWSEFFLGAPFILLICHSQTTLDKQKEHNLTMRLRELSYLNRISAGNEILYLSHMRKMLL